MSRKRVHHFRIHPSGTDPDSFNKLPREPFFEKELCLLTLFALPPILSLDRVPIDLTQTAKVGPVLEVPSTCVAQRKCPTAIVSIGPSDRTMKIRLQVNNGLLPTLIGEFGIPFMDQEEHDGARAKIERDTLPYKKMGMARQRQLGKSSLLDVVHANDGAR